MDTLAPAPAASTPAAAGSVQSAASPARPAAATPRAVRNERQSGPSRQPPHRERAIKRAPFEPNGKHPVMETELLLHTEPTTRVFDATMEPVRTALFLLEDALPRRAREDSAPIDALLEVIEARFNDVEQGLNGEVERLKTVAGNSGCQQPKRYLHVADPVTVYGYSPTFFRYLDLVLKLDEAMRWLDGLWMGRVVQTKDRGDTIVRCRNLLLHLARELQHIKDRAISFVERIEADRGKKMAARDQKRTVKAAAAELRRQERRLGHRPPVSAGSVAPDGIPAAEPEQAAPAQDDASVEIVSTDPAKAPRARAKAKAHATEPVPAEAAVVG